MSSEEGIASSQHSPTPPSPPSPPRTGTCTRDRDATLVVAGGCLPELRRICNKYWYKMVRLSISKVEVKLTCSVVKGAEPMHIRLVASNPTGFVLKIDNYYETLDHTGESVFRSVGGFVKGPLDGQSTTAHYPVTELFAQQRAAFLKKGWANKSTRVIGTLGA